MANTFGHLFRLHSFGESHGPALGAVIDGCPAGVVFREEILLRELARRRPGQNGAANAVVSPRAEEDRPDILSGIFEGRTLGTPIAVVVRNQDARSTDYAAITKAPRAGHADDVWREKFGHSDPRGGGRSSGRETLARVIGGSFARMLLAQIHPDLKIQGYALRVGPFELSADERASAFDADIEEFTARFPAKNHLEVREALKKIQSEGESWGGIAEIRVGGVPPSLGQPVFDKLKSDLARAMMSIGATSAFELGEGFVAAQESGRRFHAPSRAASPYGGIRGGISTGEDVVFRVHFKPTSSILDVAKQGRHDPCIVPRAVPVLEAMTALVLADHVLWSRLDRVPGAGAGL